jgi:hypothetical protein
MLKVILWFLLVELIQVIVVVFLCELIWKFALKPNLPKTWVRNLTMVGFS